MKPILSILKGRNAEFERSEKSVEETSDSAIGMVECLGEAALAAGIEGERFALLSFRPPAVLILGLHPSPRLSSEAQTPAWPFQLERLFGFFLLDQFGSLRSLLLSTLVLHFG